MSEDTFDAAASTGLHETTADRAAERAVLGIVSKRWNCEFKQTPVAYAIDAVFVRGSKIVSWCEVRCRKKTSSGEYPTLMWSLNKWQGAIRIFEDTNIPVFLVIEYSDGLFFLQLKRVIPDVEWAGHNKRGDVRDREPCVMLPIKWFTKLQVLA